MCSTKFKPQISLKVHPDTIRAALATVDLDAVLAKQNAYIIFKRSYGWRSWLLAPEEGVRGLLRACLQLYEPPLRHLLAEVRDLTLEAAKLSSKRSSKAARGQERSTAAATETIQQLLLDQADSLVRGWYDQTWEQLSRNLHAEAEFPAPERFSKLKSRLQQLLAVAAASTTARRNEEYKRMLQETLHTLENRGLKQQVQAPVMVQPETAIEEVEEPPSWSEFYMGWLEKKNRHGMWQKRWFALSLRQRRVWYFGSPEEQPARGTADLAGAKIVDLEESKNSTTEDGHTTFRILLPGFSNNAIDGENGQARGHSAMPKEAQQAAAALTGLRTKNIAMSLTLRAPTASSKQQWCDMLGKAIIGIPEAPQQAESQLPAPVRLPAALAVPPFQDELQDSPVGRKISTQVFRDEESERLGRAELAEAAMQRSRPRPGDGGSSSNEDASSSTCSTPKRRPNEHKESKSSKSDDNSAEEEDEEEDPEVRAQREKLLFDEIAAESERVPSAEEWAVLECVAVAVREYCVHAMEYLTEQASKIIADGMLPGGRTTELHAALLRVLIPASTGGTSEAVAQLIHEFGSEN